MTKKLIKNIEQEKSLKNYFLEFKKLAEYNRIWITTDHEDQYKNINLKVDQNFFIHLIGLQKLPMYTNVKNQKIIQKINNGTINFSSIEKNLRSLKITSKGNTKQDARYVDMKIKGLKNIKSLDPSKIFNEFNLVIFESKVLKECFPTIQSELCFMKRKADKLLLFHLNFDFENNRNYWFFKSFTYLLIKRKIYQNKKSYIVSEILKCKNCRILSSRFVPYYKKEF